MIANKSYAYDFNMPEFEPKYMPNKEDFKIIKNNKIKTIILAIFE